MTGFFSKLRSRGRRAVSMALARREVIMRNSEPLVSFTFDDFPRSALITGGPILESFGGNGTFFCCLGLMGTGGSAIEMFCRDDLINLLERNHELGCHTYDHCHAWDTSSQEFEASILRNREALQHCLPGASFRSFSYPSSCPRPVIKRRTGKYFNCCRGGGHTFNVGSIDVNFVKSCFLEQAAGDFDLISGWIDANNRARGWLILTTHDISEKPSKFGCTPTLFERAVRQVARSGATIVTVSEGLKRILNKAPVFAPGFHNRSHTNSTHVSAIL